MDKFGIFEEQIDQGSLRMDIYRQKFISDDKCPHSYRGAVNLA